MQATVPAPRSSPAGVASASPGSVGGPTQRPAAVRLAERWVPVALLALSLLSGWAIGPIFVRPDFLAWSLLPSSAILALRGLAETRREPPGAPLYTVGSVVHHLVVLVLVLLNPMGAIYCFSGYVDAERFLRGRVRLAAVVVTGVLCAVGQGGGLQIGRMPAFFGVLAAVNVVIATAMLALQRQREREVARRERIAAELAEAHRRNLDLQEQLLERARAAGMAAERERLSREIHDTVAQGLIGVITQLGAIGAVDEPVRRRVDRAEDAARDCLAEARRAVRALASPRLDDADLSTALTGLARSWQEQHELPVTLRVAPDIRTGHDEVFLRIAQEALSNVARHARATGVRLGLEQSPEETVLTVTDDGTGFDVTTTPRGHGLPGMAERLAAVGGSLTVDSAPGSGCTICARVPR